jgi:glucose-fructose oxidoreductase
MVATRRTFLGHTVLGGVGLAAGLSCTRGPRARPGAEAEARASAPERREEQSSERRLGVALLGLGSYSEGQLAPALQLTKHCALRAIVTGSPEKIPRWQERYAVADRHVYSYETLASIANDDQVDVVYVVVPTSLHAKYALMAANAGKHVWCEKPMAMTVAECQQIIDACRANGVTLSIGYRLHHEPNTQTVMEYAREKRYGAVRNIRALAGYAGAGAAGWRADRSMGGGALYDMGVYAINAIRYGSADEVVRVRRAQQSTKRPELFTRADETTEFELELSSGCVAYGRTSVGEDINSLRVDCAEGWYELDPLQPYHGVKGSTSDGKSLARTIESQQARQMDDDALAILERRPVMVPGEEGLRDVRIVQAILKAVETGAEVSV